MTADKGGSILISGSEVTLEHNMFTDNRASIGGALAFLCQQFNGCTLTLTNNTFEGNAANEGGALHYNMVRPHGLDNNKYERNTAEYGERYSSFPTFIEFSDSQSLKEIASGQRLPTSLEFRILDFDKQIISNDNKT